MPKSLYSKEQIDLMKQNYKLAELLSMGVESEFGKAIIKMLDDTISHTENEWAGKGLNTVEDNELVTFRNAVRSKLQTLKAFRRKLTEAKADQLRISQELDMATK